jgi:hypothetical protein
MALIGLSHQIPNFFGKSIMVEHIIEENFRHNEALVNKNNPVSFFVIEKNPMEFIDNIPFLYFPVSYDKSQYKVHGHSIYNYLTMPRLNFEAIQDQFTENTIGFMQQLYFTDKNTVNLTQFFDIIFDKNTISELHANPVFHNEALVRANSCVSNIDNDLSIFENSKNYIEFYKKSSHYESYLSFEKRFSDFDSFESINLDDYFNCSLEELTKISKTSINVCLESDITRRLYNGSFWLTKTQEANNLSAAKEKAHKPVITPEEKTSYINSLKRTNMISYTSNWDYFLPTYINFCGNFEHEMVAISSHIDNNLLIVVFSGTDDMDMAFSTPFDNILEFLTYIIYTHDGFITYDVFDEMKTFCTQLDY